MESRPTPIQAPEAALRLAAIVASSDDAIASKDLNGIITSWNVAAERVFGYSAAEAVGQSITMIIPPDRLAEEDVVLGKIRRGERVEHFETIRRRKDGRLINVSVTVSPIRDHNGTIVGASKIARDITEQKRIESELRSLQQRLLGLAEASASILASPTSDAVLAATLTMARDVIESDGHAIWRSDESGTWRAVKSLGISDAFAARMIAESGQRGASSALLSEPIVFEDVASAPLLAGRHEAYTAEGIVSMIVFPLIIHGTPSGTMVFYSKRRRGYQELDIQVGRALANIAAAALTTAELYDEQRRARDAADHAREQAAFLSEAGSALSASLNYEDTLAAVAKLAVPRIADWCAVDIVTDRGALQRLAVAHVDPEKIEYARMLQDRYPADPDAPGGVHEVIRTGRARFMAHIPANLIAEAARDDEHRRILAELNLTSYMCVPMMTQGKAFGAITFVSAESGREYSDADVRIATELATRAALAVENARSYARAHEANRLKDEFLATLSHELRTPLNAVLGYARMLRQGALQPDRRSSAIEVVERNATALKQIIEDVLDVSRIVAGRLRLNVEPVDLPSILSECHATVLPAAEAKGVRLEKILDPLTTPVSGDPDRLQQIVWNLLSNAIKFTARGGKVQLRLARVNSHVEVTVSDTGQGIARTFLPFVFDRFRQGDASFSREHGGLGLGLAIAKQLAELHGGTIDASSEGPGKGATFTLKLPLMIVHATPSSPTVREQPHSERRPTSVEPAPRLDGIRVLTVDDEPDSLNLLRTVLESAGAIVTSVGSAAETLASLREQVPDVLVADVGMPGMDGLALIRAIRQLPGPAANVPATALTAYARSQDRITSLASGFQMHLVKPIDPLELIVAVAALASRRLAR